MKNMRSLLFRLLVVIPMLSLTLCAETGCGGTLDPYVSGETELRLNRILQLHSGGKVAISRLIKHLSDKRDIALLLARPSSSTVDGDLRTDCGLVAAYLVELILGRAELGMKRAEAGLFLGWDDKDYVFHKGVVMTDRGVPATKPDLSNIANAYRKWWQANKTRSLEDLRGEWSSGKRPLDGSGFHWE